MSGFTGEWQSLFTQSESPYYGWTDTFEKAVELIRQYEVQTGTSFTTTHVRHAEFGRTEWAHHGCYIRFADMREPHQSFPLLQFDGVPFIIGNIKKSECHRGVQFIRRNNKFNKKKQDHDYLLPVKNKPSQRSKKIGCPAHIVIREVIRFPEYALRNNTEWKRKQASCNLRDALKLKKAVKQERRIYIILPTQEDHQGHGFDASEELLLPVDRRLIVRIKELVAEGIDSTAEIKQLLEKHVVSKHNEWFNGGRLPPKTNRRFYPTDNDIRAHVNLARAQPRVCLDSKVDQECLMSLLEEWKSTKPNDHYFLRPYKVVESDTLIIYEQTFLFVYQSYEQKGLMERYGHEICYLDATFNPLKSTLPCFFLCVQTNVQYHPVAVFITHSETADAIAEALDVIKGWNPTITPKHFLTDFSDAEINALEKAYPSSSTYLCEMQLAQTWLRWASTKTNGVVAQKPEILSRLRKIAHAETEQDLKVAVEELQNSTVWKKSPQLQNDFENVWFPQHKRWVRAFKIIGDNSVLNIRTNNDAENLNQELKQYLKLQKEKTLTSLVKIVTDKLLTGKYEKYVDTNVQSSRAKRSNHDLTVMPAYLHDRPSNFVLHCTKRTATSAYAKAQHVQQLDDYLFTVVSEEDEAVSYAVFLGKDEQLPSCECQDWKRHKLPCKHMFAVFTHSNASWESLNPVYRESVFFTLDSRLDLDLASPLHEPRTKVTKTIKSEPAMVLCPIAQPYSLTDCGILFNEIRSLTYKLSGSQTFQELHGKLAEVRDWIRTKVPQPRKVPQPKAKRGRKNWRKNAIDPSILPVPKRSKTEVDSNTLTVSKQVKKEPPTTEMFVEILQDPSLSAEIAEMPTCVVFVEV